MWRRLVRLISHAWFTGGFDDYTTAGVGGCSSVCGGGDDSGVWIIEFDECVDGDRGRGESSTDAVGAVHECIADGDGGGDGNDWAGVCGALV
jgi:hypothetical protein